MIKEIDIVLSKDSESNTFQEDGYVAYLMSASTDFVFLHRNIIIAIGIICVSLPLLRRWFAGGRCTSAARLDGKLALVTGANSGIGLHTATELARRGANVCFACRSPSAGRAAADAVRAATGNPGVFAADLPLDLASLASVRAFAEQFRRRHAELHLLVNNAGVMACPEAATADGFELQLGVNHLGHFLLTGLLLPTLRRAAGGARIVTVASKAHEWGKMHWDNLNLTGGQYSPFKAYAQSKLANVLFTRALATKLAAHGDDVTAYCLHPGAVQTNLGRHQPAYFLALFRAVAWLALKRPEEGAQTSLHCAMAPLESLHSGGYYSDCRLARPSRRAASDADALKLWSISEELVGWHWQESNQQQADEPLQD